MVNTTVYLSYCPEDRTHGIAVGKVLDSLGYSYVEGTPQSRESAGMCGILLRVQTLISEHAPTVTADTTAFLGARQSFGNGRIVDLIIGPGYVVWPQRHSCPISYVDAVNQPYVAWVRELTRVLDQTNTRDVAGTSNTNHAYAESDLDFEHDDGYIEDADYDDHFEQDYWDEF